MAKEIDSILAKINKQFGLDKNVVSMASDNFEKLSIKRVPTASDAINDALYGGLALGKLTEVAGEPGAGKTSLIFETMGLNQKIAKENGEEYYCGLFETEGSYDAQYAKDLGLDLSQFVYWDQSDVTAEEGLEILISFIKSGKFRMIAINSIAGLIPRVESEGNLSDNQMALIARLLSKALRQIVGAANKHECTILLVNQLRESFSMFSSADSAGGRALRYYSSQRITLNKVKLQAADPMTQEEGIKVNVYVKKNRYADGKNPYTKCSYYARYGQGIDNIITIPDRLIESGAVHVKGAWYSILDSEGNVEIIDSITCKFNGKAKFVKAIKESSVLLDELRTRL